MVPAYSVRIPRVPTYSVYLLTHPFAYETLTPSGASSHTLRLDYVLHIAVLTPEVLLPPVWPPPLSLATTQGIHYCLFSSRYLDVSVPSVPHHTLCVQVWLLRHNSQWVPPFRNPRINVCLRLPEAYRS